MKQVQLLPGIPMQRYGSTPYEGQPLYRVVFSDSRTDLLGGKWPDGACEYREVLRYPGIRGQWVLEKWLSAEEYAGTPAQYEKEQWDPTSGLLTTGPYPNRGEYTHCYTFPYAPTDSMIRTVIIALERSRNVSRGERKRGIMDPLEAQQAQQERRFDDIFDEAMGPFSKADTVVSFRTPAFARSGFKRGGDMPADRYVNAPLPTRDNFFGTIQRRETIDKLTGDSNASNS